MVDVNALDQALLSGFSIQTAGLVPFFTWITQLGNPLVLITFSAAIFALGKDKVRIVMAVLIIGLIFGSVIAGDLKDLVKRPRPEGARISEYLVSITYSFPSGHALSAFLAASVLGAYLGWRYRVAGYLLAAAVSFSRLFLIVHYPTDVLAGAFIGIMIGETAVYTAYRLGLCDNKGLAGYLMPPSRPASVKDVGSMTLYERPEAPASGWYYAFIAITLVLAMVSLSIGVPVLSLTSTMAIPAFVLLTTPASALTGNAKLSLAFFTIATGIGGSLLAFMGGSPALSLLVIGITIAIVIWIVHRVE